MGASTAEMLSLADVLTHLPGIAPARIRLRPLPGTATEVDVLQIHRQEKRLFELFDGILVEKAMGFRESTLAGLLITMLNNFVLPRNLGLVTAPDGMMRLFPGLVLIPDVAFVSWSRIPGGVHPTAPIPDVVPDFAIEVLSVSNTPQEMLRKRVQYFGKGVRLVWEIDAEARTLVRYTGAELLQTFSAGAVISGEPVLPGFTLNLSELFGLLDRKQS
jgi:Uma2 family endonuclease